MIFKLLPLPYVSLILFPLHHMLLKLCLLAYVSVIMFLLHHLIFILFPFPYVSIILLPLHHVLFKLFPLIYVSLIMFPLHHVIFKLTCQLNCFLSTLSQYYCGYIMAGRCQAQAVAALTLQFEIYSQGQHCILDCINLNSAVQGSTVQCSTMQYGEVQCSAV